jgi:ribokinase
VGAVGPDNDEFGALDALREHGVDADAVETVANLVVENGRRFTVTPPSVSPVDTTGAGDTLDGFLAARLAAGAEFQDALQTAVVAGALSTRATSARGAIPTLAAVREFQHSGQ